MLEWSNAPAGVVAFVMIMHDTDVTIQKKAEDNLHWMVFNIPASATRAAGGRTADSHVA